MKVILKSIIVGGLTLSLSHCGAEEKKSELPSSLLTAPNDGELIISDVKSTSVMVHWTPFTGSGFEYVVVYSEVADDVADLASVDAAGMRSGSWQEDLGEIEVSSLKPGVTYYFNVLARSSVNTRGIYKSTEKETLASGAPIPAAESIAISSLTGSSLVLDWTAATDDIDPTQNLQYAVYQSTSNNIDTIANILANGTKVMDFTYNRLNFPVTGLVDYTGYYFNIIVRDSEGNQSAYTMANTETLDVSAPIATSNAIVLSNLASTSLTLTWTKAEDNKTAATAITYSLYSGNEALTDFDKIRNFGRRVGAPLVDEDTVGISSLTSGNTYYFNIIASDAAGNESLYTELTVTTP